MRRNKIILFITLLIPFSMTVMGCQKILPTSPVATASSNAEAQAYADAHKAITTAFGASLKQIAARPIPKPPKNATKRERREIVAHSLDAITAVAADALTKLDRLTPPPSMREIHDATRNVFVTYRDDNAAYVAAVRRGNRQEAERIGAKMDTDTQSAFTRLRAAVIKELTQEGKTQEQAEATTKNLVL